MSKCLVFITNVSYPSFDPETGRHTPLSTSFITVKLTRNDPGWIENIKEKFIEKAEKRGWKVVSVKYRNGIRKIIDYVDVDIVGDGQTVPSYDV